MGGLFEPDDVANIVRIAIRPYEARHLAATARLWSESFHSAALPDASGGSIRELAARIPVEMANGWSAWLAWEGRELVGFLALMPAEARLHQIFVAPGAQRRGVGLCLLNHAKRMLPGGFWLSTFASNAGACRFYERHGLTETEYAVHPQQGVETVVYRWRAQSGPRYI